MLTELWKLKNEVYIILQNEYDDYCKFILKENPYHGVFCTFYFEFPSGFYTEFYMASDLLSYYSVKDTEVNIHSYGIDIESSLVNLLKLTAKLTQNAQIEALSNQAIQLDKEHNKTIHSI